MAYLLQQLLSRSAARYPDQVAGAYQGKELTYAQLEQLSNQVARALIGHGVQRGDRVGICVHKSLASLVCVFGVLKSGGVYVPLDPKAPPARLSRIALNCGLRTLLTTQNKLQSVTEFVEAGLELDAVLLIDVDREPGGQDQAVETDLPATLVSWQQILNLPQDGLSDPGQIETDLAYILYTSGSTGEPKGVMISHRTILTFINWCAQKFDFGPEDRFSSHAPLHFDLSTLDIYAAIKVGATVVLIPESASIFPYQLGKLLAEERISVTYLVPSILSLMVNYGKLDEHNFSCLRLVLFAGEVFPIKYLRRLAESLPGPEFFNLYGPTETNVCTYYRVRRRDLEPGETRPVPIGRACENLEIFVLADDGSPVEQPGESGELWVRGPGVAQGYWGDPVKTAERFVPSPLQDHYSETVYRSGDVVMLDADGENWRFVGRCDEMVKSRGYRIELGEVEAALYAHEGVKEVAVVALPDALIGSRLKAFVVCQAGFSPDPRQLQAFCKTRLPAYMIPEKIEFLSGLPKTSNGKVDRVRLAGGVDPVDSA